MSKKYILALDQGTTSSRAILFDQTGRSDGRRGMSESTVVEPVETPANLDENGDGSFSVQSSAAAFTAARADGRDAHAQRGGGMVVGQHAIAHHFCQGLWGGGCHGSVVLSIAKVRRALLLKGGNAFQVIVRTAQLGLPLRLVGQGIRQGHALRSGKGLARGY